MFSQLFLEGQTRPQDEIGDEYMAFSVLCALNEVDINQESKDAYDKYISSVRHGNHLGIEEGEDSSIME